MSQNNEHVDVRLQRLEAGYHSLLGEVKDQSVRITSIETKQAVGDVLFQQVADDVKDIKDGQKWLSRLIATFLILGILGAIVQFGGAT